MTTKENQNKNSHSHKSKTQNLRPIKGILAVSALATTLGAPKQTIAIASKNVECGAVTKTGASLGFSGVFSRPRMTTGLKPAVLTTNFIRAKMETRSLLYGKNKDYYKINCSLHRDSSSFFVQKYFNRAL